jgi:DNA ligase (NAD+)
MDIEGLGEAIIAQLTDLKIVKDPGDLYFLTKSQISNLERMGDKSAQNILDALEKSKSNSLERVIFALGIRYVGVNSARILAGCFTSIDELFSADTEELMEIDGIGEKMAESIHRYGKAPQTRELLTKLARAGVKLAREAPPVPEVVVGVFAGKTVVLTGKLSHYTREDAAELIRKYGGKISESISSKTDYVLVGEEPGSKLAKAKALSIPLLSEADFIKMVESSGK